MSLICCFRMEREKAHRETGWMLVVSRDRPQVWLPGGLADRPVVAMRSL